MGLSGGVETKQKVKHLSTSGMSPLPPCNRSCEATICGLKSIQVCAAYGTKDPLHQRDLTLIRGLTKL